MSAASRARTLELVVLSGVSGSGKTTALHALEDAGYYCVDNLPSGLLQSFLSMAIDQPEMHHIALVMDIRGASQDPDYPRHLEAVADGGQPLRILFLDSADERIISRFKETRRRHPLIASGEIKAIGEAIESGVCQVDHPVIVVKSTVPVGTTSKVRDVIAAVREEAPPIPAWRTSSLVRTTPLVT